jgi:hypothetical protein
MPSKRTRRAAEANTPPVEEKPLSTPRAAGLLGVTPDQFRQLAENIDLKPSAYYKNPHYRSGPECPLWPADVVRALVGGADVAAVLERARRLREAKATAPARRQATFAKRYPDYRLALPATAEALFSLNRYAKHRSCTRDHRDDIYDLKNGFVRLLCEVGCVRGARLHTTERAGLKCNRCGGAGGYEDDEFDEFDQFEEDEGCRKCFGTGWYRPPTTLEFIAFRFEVGGKRYSWHQPRELVNWPVELTEGVDAWELEDVEKPLSMSRERFAEAKELIRFVLAQYQAVIRPAG